MKGWKTLVFAVVIAIIGALDAFDWAEIIPDAYEAFAIPAIALIFGYLRTITTTAVGKKE